MFDPKSFLFLLSIHKINYNRNRAAINEVQAYNIFIILFSSNFYIILAKNECVTRNIWKKAHL